MNKEEFIRGRGEAAYEKLQQQSRDWQAQHRKECNATHKKWRAANPDKVLADGQEQCCKGGKYYVKHLEYNRTGLQGERARIRAKHQILYYDIKQATPNSVLHHEWVFGTANYRGVALVEKDAHENGIIKVIVMLEGKITLFTEKEIKEQGGN